MFKNFLLKQMLKKQGVPESQIDSVLLMMEKNPELFKKIAQEIEHRIKTGSNQAAASLEVMRKYEAELKKLAQ